MKKIVTVFLLLLISSGISHAARPLATDDAGTVEKGKFETELSFDHCQYRPDGTCRTPGIQLKHGLTEKMDIGIAFAHPTEKDAVGATVGWGMSPLSVGLKMALFKEHRFLPDLSVSAGFETGDSGYRVNGIASREIAGVGLHLNLGCASSGAAMARGAFATGLAAEYTFRENFRVCAEINSELLDDGKQVLGNSGLIGGSIDLGFGTWDLGGRLFDKRGPRWQATTGLTIGF
ncbi:MAG: hypothetical protein QME74_10365 [Candidatus Edwardsbacteria bacterium]|nr:hypothetical protein [Candidatus Edwardsbacteria bacterium]